MADAKQLILPNIPDNIPLRPAAEQYAVYSRVALELCSRLREAGYDYTVPEEPLPAEDNYDENDDWQAQDNSYGDILEILRETHTLDGFELAKSLSDRRFDVDARVVSILDDAAYLKVKTHNAQVREWVSAHALTPKYAVHDQVRVLTYADRERKEHTGTVMRVYEDVLRYTVAIPELGHGMIKGSSITIGNLLDEEKILGRV